MQNAYSTVINIGNVISPLHKHQKPQEGETSGVQPCIQLQFAVSVVEVRCSVVAININLIMEHL
jgi:hypothetical protein